MNILYLVHRIPYPPNKGDKIRSWHILRHLSQRHRVYLGTFIDSAADWQHREILAGHCAGCCFVGLSPRLARLRSLRGLLTGQALTFPYYHSRRLARWVRQLLARQRIDAILVFSSSMAQYVPPAAVADRPAVVDFVDVDSEKWLAYGERHPGPLRWLYRREGMRLRRAEQAIAARFRSSLFVTAEEAALFRRLAPAVADRVQVLTNGVDTDYFSPQGHYENPYPPGGPVLVFTGAMDYWANVDAVTGFVRDCLPLVRRRQPDVRFWIVGARPLPEVQRLAATPGVQVTGTVPDVRPYLAHARLAVAPLQIARGLQNKVLEAMAMGRAVVATPAAMEGIPCPAPLDTLVRPTPAAMAERILELLPAGRAEALGRLARDQVVARFDWAASLGLLDRLLGGSEAGGVGG